MMQIPVTKNTVLDHRNSFRRRARAACVALLFLFTPLLGPEPARAQDTEGERLKQLEELKKEAELRKAIAEARKAELDARFPQSDIDTLKGETKLEGTDRV